MRYPPSLLRLIEELKRLPGVGDKTAQRLALHLLSQPADRALALARALTEMKERIRFCDRCFNLTEEELCAVCRDPGRDRRLLCAVESPRDLLAIEATGHYRGGYHVLMGVLSPLRGMGPEALRLPELLRRVGEDKVQEVIVATNLDVEGEATASYLSAQLKPLGVRVTRLARGIPLGGSLEQADRITLGLALEGRREL